MFDISNKEKGLFITFEGIDGCGKTTQLNLLDNFLKENNIQTIQTLEPGGCEIGTSLRKILLHSTGFVAPKAELFMYLADRAQHVEEIIKKNINEKKVVLCDRYIDSLIAYQGYGRDGDIENLKILNNIATSNLLPDVTFLFDIDPIIAQQRLGKEKDRLEQEGLIFYQKVQKGYLELAKENKDRIKVIDANRPKEVIFEEIKEILNLKTYEKKL